VSEIFFPDSWNRTFSAESNSKPNPLRRTDGDDARLSFTLTLQLNRFLLPLNCRELYRHDTDENRLVCK
jgi:hypothetical protein